jgi:hypothetical protein
LLDSVTSRLLSCFSLESESFLCLLLLTGLIKYLNLLLFTVGDYYWTTFHNFSFSSDCLITITPPIYIDDLMKLTNLSLYHYLY